MNFDVWKGLIVVVICFLQAAANPPTPVTVKNSTEPIDKTTSKKTIIPGSSDDYTSFKPRRRQNVIHPVDEDVGVKTSDEDDIESLGRSVDAAGKVMSTTVSKHDKIDKSVVKSKEVNEKDVLEKAKDVTEKGSTKDIIERIKEIQEKLFKRTGSKELESKLKQMNPDSPLALLKSQLADVAKISDGAKKSADAKSSSTNATSTSNATSSDTKNGTGLEPPPDGSKHADRRKIIPEEVVDKILEKFQQLRQEAKNMALAEAKHETEKENSASQVSASPTNPYASIEQPKDNTELKNLTSNVNDVRAVGLGGDPDEPPSQAPTQIDDNPSPASFSPNPQQQGNPQQGNSANPIMRGIDLSGMTSSTMNPSQGGSGKSNTPLMFIKTGQTLVPVFNSPQNSMTVTGNGAAEMRASGGPPMPNDMPNNVMPLTPQQLSSFIGPPPGPPLSPQLSSMMGQAPSGQAQLSQQLSNFMGPPPGAQMVMNQQSLPGFPDALAQPAPSYQYPYMPSPSSTEQATSRCSIPGVSCSPPNPPGSMYPSEVQMTDKTSGEVQASPYGPGMVSASAPNINDVPSTSSLVNEIMHSPGFPMLAARLMSEPSMTRKDVDEDQAGETRSPSAMPSQVEEGMDQGSINFGLQQNLATNNPGQPSMLNPNYFSSHMVAPMNQLMDTHNNNRPLAHNPYEEVHPEWSNQMDQLKREQQIFNPKNMATNDISDPLPPFNEMERSEYTSRNPDSLLDFAKFQSMKENFQPDEMVTATAPQPDQSPSAVSAMSRNDITSAARQFASNPGTLLDQLHAEQLQGEMLGAGDPTSTRMKSIRPDMPPQLPQSSMPLVDMNFYKPDKAKYGENPDQLLEMLNKQNSGAIRRNNFGLAQALLQTQAAKHMTGMARNDVPGRQQNTWGTPDPSFADVILDHNNLGQQFDVRSKGIVTEHNGDLPFYAKREHHGRGSSAISVLPESTLQLHHGRMSIDSANVVSNFFKDEQYRNKILHPMFPRIRRYNTSDNTTSENKTSDNTTSKKKTLVNEKSRQKSDHARTVISKNLEDDHIELEVNGKKINNKNRQRSRIVAGDGNSETITSKGPIQIELSHGENNGKIVNIVTNSRYNVTEDRRRNTISKITQLKH